MLARRIQRDTVERGRDLHGILQRVLCPILFYRQGSQLNHVLSTEYLTFVKPSFDNFVLPTAKYADIVSGRLSLSHRIQTC